MTRDEYIAARFASRVRVELQRARIDKIEEEYREKLEAALEQPKATLEALNMADDSTARALSAQADFIPYRRHDFVTDGIDYWEVAGSRLELDSLTQYGSVDISTVAAPPKDWLTVKLEVYAVRKSGTLARYSTYLNLDRVSATYRKADVSEDLRLRRAVKHRLRTRLEGGE